MSGLTRWKSHAAPAAWSVSYHTCTVNVMYAVCIHKYTVWCVNVNPAFCTRLCMKFSCRAFYQRGLLNPWPKDLKTHLFNLLKFCLKRNNTLSKCTPVLKIIKLLTFNPTSYQFVHQRSQAAQRVLVSQSAKWETCKMTHVVMITILFFFVPYWLSDSVNVKEKLVLLFELIQANVFACGFKLHHIWMFHSHID